MMGIVSVAAMTHTPLAHANDTALARPLPLASAAVLAYRLRGGRRRLRMIGRRGFFAGMMLLGGSGTAWAQAAAGEGLGGFLRDITDRIDVTVAQLPAVGRFLAGLPSRIDLPTLALLVGIFAAGLAAEWAARQLLVRVRHRIHSGGKKSPLRSLLQVMLLDGLALLALWVEIG